jgi:polar amino acid transport system substrate-binding protein
VPAAANPVAVAAAGGHPWVVQDQQGARSVIRLALAALAAFLLVAPAKSDDAPLAAAISLDIPPYVMKNAGTGLEVDIVDRALAPQAVRFVQMPYGEIATAVPDGRAELAVGVRGSGDGAHLSQPFIAFANVAATRKDDGITINEVADLAGRRVLTWQGADRELGPDFERLFAAGGPQRERYEEFADQAEQVRAFWRSDQAVAIIDRAIFTYFSKAMGHDMDKVQFHFIFPPVTDFKVAFADAALRDRFDRGLDELCRSGAYADLLERYGVVLERSPCLR